MSNAKILILNADLMNFKNDNTGEISDMTRINYCIDCDSSDEHVGPAILQCFKRGNVIETIKPFCKREVTAEISVVPQKNGFKYILSSINGKSL